MKNIFIQKLSNLAFSNGLIEKHPKTKGMKNMRKKNEREKIYKQKQKIKQQNQ
jgi:hypothetical protein